MMSKKNTYIFTVPATYVYEIDADTEEEARGLLREEGGITILGDLLEISDKDYRDAYLEEAWSGDKILDNDEQVV